MTTRKTYLAQVETALTTHGYVLGDPEKFPCIDLPLKADLIIDGSMANVAMTIRWQNTTGSGDRKPALDFFKLLDIIENYDKVKRGYIIIGGVGYNTPLGKYYLDETWKKYLLPQRRPLIKVITNDEFLLLLESKTF